MEAVLSLPCSNHYDHLYDYRYQQRQVDTGRHAMVGVRSLVSVCGWLVKEREVTIYHISGRVPANDDWQTNSVSLKSRWRFLSVSVCQRGGKIRRRLRDYIFFFLPLFFWNHIVGFDVEVARLFGWCETVVRMFWPMTKERREGKLVGGAISRWQKRNKWRKRYMKSAFE